MYPLGHLGVPVGVAYALRHRWPALQRLDYRFLMLGALLPDLIDKGLFGLWGPPVSKGLGHLLVAALLPLAVGLLLAGRRGGDALATLGAGMLSHQLLDLPFLWPEAFLFPLLGDPGPPAVSRIHWPFDNAYLALGEYLGTILLVAVAARARLHRRPGFSVFLRTGRLPPAPADPQADLRPRDTPEVAYEFYAPFAHVPGRFEWCRIRSASHGVFDCFILLDPGGTGLPADVYVSTDAGERFLAERFPECRRYRVAPEDLRITEADGGRVVEGLLRAKEGPVAHAELRIAALPDAQPEQVPYGGEGRAVWGSARWTCWGVDLNLRAEATGRVVSAEGKEEVLDRVPSIVAVGSFGRLAPR